MSHVTKSYTSSTPLYGHCLYLCIVYCHCHDYVQIWDFAPWSNYDRFWWVNTILSLNETVSKYHDAFDQFFLPVHYPVCSPYIKFCAWYAYTKVSLSWSFATVLACSLLPLWRLMLATISIGLCSYCWVVANVYLLFKSMCFLGPSKINTRYFHTKASTPISRLWNKMDDYTSACGFWCLQGDMECGR